MKKLAVVAGVALMLVGIGMAGAQEAVKKETACKGMRAQASTNAVIAACQTGSVTKAAGCCK